MTEDNIEIEDRCVSRESGKGTSGKLGYASIDETQ